MNRDIKDILQGVALVPMFVIMIPVLPFYWLGRSFREHQEREEEEGKR